MREFQTTDDELHIQLIDHNQDLVVRWRNDWSKVRGNPHGVTGWATVVRGDVANLAPYIRIHVCAHAPCKARYAASKYGNLPPPYHVAVKAAPPPCAVAEAPSAVAEAPSALAEAPSAVAEAPSAVAEAPSAVAEAPSAAAEAPSVVAEAA